MNLQFGVVELKVVESPTRTKDACRSSLIFLACVKASAARAVARTDCTNILYWWRRYPSTYVCNPNFPRYI